MRPPPHLLKVHSIHMKWGELSGTLIGVSESMEGVGWTLKPSSRKLEEVSLT